MTAVMEREEVDDPPPDPPAAKGRKARLSVSLPDDLYREVKARGIDVREVLRAEVFRQQKCEGIDRYIEDLVAEVGEPTSEDEAYAAAFVDRLLRRHDKEAK
jgi:hypothetical protein